MASLIETPRSFRRRSEFYHQLSVLQQAGIGVTQSLEQTPPPSQRDCQHVRETIDRLNAGETFSESLKDRESWLPAFDRMMIKAGEAGGRLDDTLRTLSDHYAQRSALIRDVLLRLAYPVFIVHFIILMPGIISYGASLLGSGGASFLGAFSPSLLTVGALYAAVFFVLYLGQANRGFALRYWLEKIWHRVPMFGPALKELKLSRLSFSLHALLNAGVNVREAWESAASASGFPQNLPRPVRHRRGLRPTGRLTAAPGQTVPRGWHATPQERGRGGHRAGLRRSGDHGGHHRHPVLDEPLQLHS